MRRQHFTAADFARIRAAFAAGGLDAEYLNGDDIEELRRRGCTADEVIEYGLRLAARTGERRAVSEP
jgi:hypothetical protein